LLLNFQSSDLGPPFPTATKSCQNVLVKRTHSHRPTPKAYVVEPLATHPRSVVYDPADMQELSALIRARISTPRALLGTKPEGPADVLRRLVRNERG
jgi:hypothetical protein